MDGFVEWPVDNHLLLNLLVEKTKKMVIDFRRKGKTLRPRCNLDKDLKLVEKHLIVTINNQLDWRTNVRAVDKKGSTC